MLFTENEIINGREFTHTWSDLYTIERDGVEYDEAYDPAEFGRVYVETNNLKEAEATEEEYAEAGKILMGVSE